LCDEAEVAGRLEELSKSFDLVYSSHAAVLRELTRVSAIGYAPLPAPVTSGDPTTPRVVGRGGVANTRVPRGQGIPTGVAFRVQRTTTTTKSRENQNDKTVSFLSGIRACLKNDKTHKEADLFPQSCVIFSRNTPSMPRKCLVLRKNLSLLCILKFIKQALVLCTYMNTIRRITPQQGYRRYNAGTWWR
jgi:hypothetical protein